MASAQALAERAEHCVDTFELPLALKFYDKALALEPDNCALLDAVGELLMQLDDAERAIAVLQKSVALEPDGNFAAWTNLGQLLGGATAVQCYEKGIGLLRTRERALRKRTTKGAAGAEARQDLCTAEQNICAALSAIAEIYLTDLCDEPDAEAACERAVEQAALQACANLRISQCRPVDAKTALEAVVKHICTAVDAGDVEGLPSHEFRTTTAKLLIEVEHAEAACEVLETLLLEDEDNPELRYLCAIAAARAGESETASTQVEWYEKQLEKPSCPDQIRQWSTAASPDAEPP
ncbi:hypothetical protein T492DRAFT_886219 [Pavlovales sp. CCMP2436]|nr:hypothetical protein T492DRAFT_886219 [Pavlovales sp. CCMP2436]